MTLDYSRTARRLGWESVPAAAVRALEEVLEGTVSEAGPPVSSGFGGQYAGPVSLLDVGDRVQPLAQQGQVDVDVPLNQRTR